MENAVTIFFDNHAFDFIVSLLISCALLFIIRYFIPPNHDQLLNVKHEFNEGQTVLVKATMEVGVVNYIDSYGRIWVYFDEYASDECYTSLEISLVDQSAERSVEQVEGLLVG